MSEPAPTPPTVADLYDRVLDEAARRPRALDTIYNDALSRAVVIHSCPVVLKLNETECVILTSDGGPLTRQPARFADAPVPGQPTLEPAPAPKANPNLTPAENP
jgi:hypothetical protein